MRWETNKKVGWYLVLIAFAVAPMVIYPVFVMKVICFALFACAFNLLIGYAGLVSFGHAAFFGGGGYLCGYALTKLGLPMEAGLLVGTLTGALLGAVFGLLAIRRQGVYFSMITLALAQMLYFFYLQAPFTGGEDGLQAIPRGKLFGLFDLHNDMLLYYVVLAIGLAGFVFIVRVVHSPYGQVLKSIRENEARAISLGYDVDRYKLLAFVFSAALAGLAGATKAIVVGFATLTDAHWAMSGLVILMTLIGGMGTFIGPIVGAVVIITLENKLGEFGHFLASVTGVDWFNAIGSSITMITGAIFMLCVLAFRKGVIGELMTLVNRQPRPTEPPHA